MEYIAILSPEGVKCARKLDSTRDKLRGKVPVNEIGGKKLNEWAMLRALAVSTVITMTSLVLHKPA